MGGFVCFAEGVGFLRVDRSGRTLTVLRNAPALRYRSGKWEGFSGWDRHQSQTKAPIPVRLGLGNHLPKLVEGLR